jgi:hypothetical protein
MFSAGTIRTPGPVERKLLWLTWRELKNDGDASLQRIGFAIASLFAQELCGSDHINSSDGVNHGKLTKRLSVFVS